MKRAVGLMALLMLSACASQQPATVASEGPAVHAGSGTVLQAPGRGPELCLGGVATSLPPQCGGVPLVGWDWAVVEGEESANGTTWGEYRVAGLFDGIRLTLTEPAQPKPPFVPDKDEDITTSCPTPDGGWRAEDPGRAGEDALSQAVSAARAEPDHAALWVDYLSPPENGLTTDPDRLVLNVAFTGDLERHERQLRQVWGGPLCLNKFERTLRSLNDIQQELTQGTGKELGLEVLYSATMESRGVLEMGVTAASDEQRAAVAERYGDAVELEPGLRPVP